MLRTILIYGAAAGVVVGAPMFVITTLTNGHPPCGMVIGYLTMLVALSAVFLAIKRQRDVDGGGVIRFWPALGLGLAVSFVAGIFYVVAWEAALAVTHLDFAAVYAQTEIAQAQARGVSGAAMERLKSEMDAFRVHYANPLYRVPETFAEIFPVGVLVSLISAALLRNSRFLPARAR